MRAMTLMLWLAIALLQATTPAAATPADPLAGEWRGTFKAAQGAETPFVISIAKTGDRYAGVTSGLAEASEVPLVKIAVDGTTVSFEAAAESRLGVVTIGGDLQLAGNKLSGPATLGIGAQKFSAAIDLTRRGRTTVLQRHVEQKIEYFVGRWTFEYTGAELPPLSVGGRRGTIDFSRTASTNFATGRVDGDVGGQSFREAHAVGVDPATASVVYVEHRADGSELVCLGSWKSPLAITFQASPLVANGKTYQLRRVLSITSDDAFEMTEEFSVDGGAFRRLGNGHFTRIP